MKAKYLLYLFLILCFACTDNVNIVNYDSSQIKKIVLTMPPVQAGYIEGSDSIGSLIKTRAGFTFDTGSSGAWHTYFENTSSSVDTMGIFPNGGYQIPFVVPLNPGQISSSVVITAQGWMTKKNTTYGVYLPYKFENKNSYAVPWDMRKVPHQKDNFDWSRVGLSMIYASDSSQVKGDTILASIFMKGAVVRVSCTMPSAGTYVKMMLVSPQTDQFVVYGMLNMFKNEVTSDYLSLGKKQILAPLVTTNHLSLVFDNVTFNTANQVLRGFFSIAPCQIDNVTLEAFVWDSNGNIYVGTRPTTMAITRHTYYGLAFTNMTLYTGPAPSLNPWEKDENVCPTCTPVAF